jgi:hypothetical protein
MTITMVAFFTGTGEWRLWVGTDCISIARIQVRVGTFINVITEYAIARVSNVTLTVVASRGVETLRVGITVIITGGTFINIFAITAVTSITVVTKTVVTVFRIGTAGLFMAFMTEDTFVDVFAFIPTSETAWETFAGVATLGISTHGIRRTLVVCCTFINIIACFAIPAETGFTATIEPVITVGTVGVLGTCMATTSTLVYIRAHETITFGTWITFTFVGSNSIGTCGLLVTSMGIVITFVRVTTSVAITFITATAATWVRADRITTFGMLRAAMVTFTLINVTAYSPITTEAVLACAWKWSIKIVTVGMGRAIVISDCAFIFIMTYNTITNITFHTGTIEVTVWVVAICVLVADMCTITAFVDIVTETTVAGKAIFTCASIWPFSIITMRMGITLVSSGFTFVVVLAYVITITAISKWTFTSVCSDKVCTDSLRMAWIHQTFVNIFTLLAVAKESSITETCVRTRGITACCMFATSVGTNHTFVDIGTLSESITLVTWITFTFMWSHGVGAGAV